MAIVVLDVVILLFDNLREKKSVPLTKLSGITCFKDSCGTPVENRCPRGNWADFFFFNSCSNFCYAMKPVLSPH